jgi:putative ABC transport system permease protein
MPVRIANLRKVDWSKFSLNFFMVFPPGVLENAPGFQLITTRIPEGMTSGQLQRTLVEKFPNVSAIDLTLVLTTVRSILDRVGYVIEVLALFTLLAGLPILAGTLLNGRDQRLQESVLLRTLGASSRQVQTILLIEYATLGTLAALAGIVLSIAAHASLATWVFEDSPWPQVSMLLSVGGGVIAVSVIAGTLLSRGVCNHPPLEILRKVG